MPYAAIPIDNFPKLMHLYKVVNQVFNHSDKDNMVRLPYIILEDDFTTEQTTEIQALEGIIFESTNAYHIWKASVNIEN